MVTFVKEYHFVTFEKPMGDGDGRRCDGEGLGLKTKKASNPRLYNLART